ncbi:MAG: hypothetical protein M4579_007120 [Chaenotheca gracillima]|nr:MAG: hypothetical protein M4579_007120 [Chaenotheca gracillima]
MVYQLDYNSDCKVMTRDYMLVAKAAGVEVDASVVDDLSKLHIELARLRSFWWVAAISLGCLLGYGWSLHAKITMAVPLVLQFFIGFMITGVFNMCMTLLVDVHPLAPATSQASLNIVRCSLAAGGIAVLQILIDAVGVGWCFTVVTVICLSTIPLVWAEIKWGPKWRESRATVEQKHSDESQSPVMADKTKA